MSVLPIYLYGSDVLSATAKPVKDLDNSIVKLVFDMMETMKKANGIGLAATQVGEMNSVIVIDISDVEEKQDEEAAETQAEIKRTSPHLPRKLVLINPEILSEEGKWTMEEGCLSIPEVRAEVERPERVRVKFRDANFEETEVHADGLLARVLQHEIDHLDGILFIDRISSAQRTPLRAQLRKIKKGEVETSYPVVSAPARKRSGGVEV